MLNFFCCLYLLGQIRPTSFVSVPGGQATFLFFADVTVDALHWLVNDVLVDPDDDNTITEFRPTGNVIGSLSFTNISMMLNQSRVRCEFTTSGMVVSSPNSTLLVQGYRTIHKK